MFDCNYQIEYMFIMKYIPLATLYKAFLIFYKLFIFGENILKT